MALALSAPSWEGGQLACTDFSSRRRPWAAHTCPSSSRKASAINAGLLVAASYLLFFVRKWASGGGCSREGLDGTASPTGHGHCGSAHTLVPESDDEGAGRLPTLCSLCPCRQGQAGKAPGQADVDHPLPAQGTAAQNPQEGGRGRGLGWREGVWLRLVGREREWRPHPWEGNSCWRSWTGLPARPLPGIQLAVPG